MKSYPKFSVIVPFYNGKKYLNECLDSILDQNFDDWNIVMIDDCSNDGSIQICEDFAKNDDRIKIIRNKVNIGPGLSRNKGIKLANGKYIVFVDCDDSICAQGLSKLWDAIVANRDPDMLKVDYNELLSNGQIIERKNEKDDCFIKVEKTIDFLKNYLKRNRIGFRAWEFVYKRSILEKNNILFGESRIWEDNEFTIKNFLHSKVIGYYRKPFYQYRTGLAGTLTCSHSDMWEQIIKAAISMLGLYFEGLDLLYRNWILKCVNSCILEFEDIAGAIRLDTIESNMALFEILNNRLHLMNKYIKKDGLLWYLRRSINQETILEFVTNKKKQAAMLIENNKEKIIFAFPATRRGANILSILQSDGYKVMGLLDNNKKKQGAWINKYPIFQPEIIRDTDNREEIFIIISTATKTTGKLLSAQLMAYGLQPKKHFKCTWES